MCMAQEKTNTLVNRIIFVLSLLGIAMAVYVLQGWLRQSSILCFTGGGCDIVRKSPASYLFGVIPVPAVGLIGYSILAILAFLRTTKLANRYSRNAGHGHIRRFICLLVYLYGDICNKRHLHLVRHFCRKYDYYLFFDSHVIARPF